MFKRVVAICLVTMGANAADADVTQDRELRNYVYAEVLQVDPIIEIVREPVSHEVCRDVHSGRGNRSTTPLILGGVIGGIIGNQFGSGGGRVAATVAGAALGGSVGVDIGRRRNDHVDVRRHCEVTEDFRQYERVAGYRVKYRYEGEVRTAETREHPGKYLKLELSIASS